MILSEIKPNQCKISKSVLFNTKFIYKSNMQLRGMYCVMTLNISIINLSLVNNFYHVNHKSYQGDTVIKKFDTEKDSIHRETVDQNWDII